jgi:hypothetical protein
MKLRIITALSSAVLGLALANLVGLHSPYLTVVCIVAAYVTLRRVLDVGLSLRPQQN